MTPSSFKQNPRSAGRMIDGQAFVMTPEDNKLHSLNGCGSWIWALAEQGITLAQIATEVAARYDVPPLQAADDAQVFLEELLRRGILIREDQS